MSTSSIDSANQKSMRSGRQIVADLMADAMALASRVNDRLRVVPAHPIKRHGRKVLNDRLCLELAGFSAPDDYVEW